MSSYWKIGAVSGLIAGILAGMVFSVSIYVAASLGFFLPFWRSFIANGYAATIPLGTIFGVILGIIYSKVYNLIPQKGVFKSLCYALVIYLICDIRSETFDLVYGFYPEVTGIIFSGFFMWIGYGLVLGIIYEYLHRKFNVSFKEEKTVSYEMRSAIIPGAISGFFGGVAASIPVIIGTIGGFGGLNIMGITSTAFDFLISQGAAHIFLNMVWGIVYGAIFARVYNLIPGKKLLKGICYALMIFLVTNVQYIIYYEFWIAPHNWSIAMDLAYAWLVVGFAQLIVFGIVLGLLYRKPSE